jgi:hypothetical protein
MYIYVFSVLLYMVYEMRKIVATLLKNSSSHSLRVAVMAQVLSSVSLTMRDNVQSEGPKDHFRKSIAIPFLDYTINEMKTRFTDLHARAALGLQGLNNTRKKIQKHRKGIVPFHPSGPTQLFQFSP